MNCRNCKKLSSTKVVGKAIKNEPYKYKCQKNKFPSISSTNELGKSYNDGEYEYYTESQLKSFISENKMKFCFQRYNITNSNIISIIALSISIGSILISLNPSKKEVKAILDKNITDSIYFDNRIKVLIDSLDQLESRLNNYYELTDEKLQGITSNLIKRADSAKYEHFNFK